MDARGGGFQGPRQGRGPGNHREGKGEMERLRVHSRKKEGSQFT